MHFAKRVLAMVGIALMLFAVGCAGGNVGPGSDSNATIEAKAPVTAGAAPATEATAEPRVEQDLNRQVTSTPQPSPTPYPGTTPLPSPTRTPTPTVANTPISLATPLPDPSDTPVPTNTPLPKPTNTPIPTSTPAPSPLEMMWNQRVAEAFAPSDCPPATELELGDADYKGPLIDTHFHMSHLWDAPLHTDTDGGGYDRAVLSGEYLMHPPILGKNVTMTEIVCSLDREGIDSAYAFFFVESERPGQLQPYLDVIQRTMELYPTRFVPFIQAMCCNETVPTVDASTLSEYLEFYPGLFQGTGEIVLYDQPREGGGRKAEDWPPDAPFLLEVYQVARNHNLVVWMHPGEGHQDSLERTLEQHPDLNFIVHGPETYGHIGNLMENYSNIYFAVNELYGGEHLLRPGYKSQFLAHFKDYETLIEKDLATWQELIETYPDRFMWATDRGNMAGLWTYDADVGQILVDYARAFIGRLDPTVQENFAYKNAERIVQD